MNLEIVEFNLSEIMDNVLSKLTAIQLYELGVSKIPSSKELSQKIAEQYEIAKEQFKENQIQKN